MVNSGAFVYFEKRQAKDIWLFMCHSMVILIVVALLSLRSWAADPDKIRNMITKAEAGDPSAQCDLGVAYITGDGIGKDLGKAAEWIEKSALQGNSHAAYILGQMYMKGGGVKESATAAVK